MDDLASELLSSEESGRLRLIRDGEVAFLLNLRERCRRLRFGFSGRVAMCSFRAVSALCVGRGKESEVYTHTCKTYDIHVKFMYL